jgi:hypothetical protein
MGTTRLVYLKEGARKSLDGKAGQAITPIDFIALSEALPKHDRPV